jgi:uncharacterized protein YjbI with pentapeptide repeats
MAEEKYDQYFFLALALKGKDAWNAWRRDPANEDVHVTFASIDFSEATRDEIDFSGFEFGDNADFSGCKWRGVKLEEAVRVAGGFNAIAFRPGRAFFRGAAFGRKANVNRASFLDWAAFLDATFGQDTCFTDASFGEHAMLDASFGMFADFTGAVFGKGASFYGAAFGLCPKFNEAHFKGWVAFSGKSQDQWIIDASSRMDPEAFKETKQRHEASWKDWGSRPDRILQISFARAHFDGADFSSRSFEHTADFTGTRFYSPPSFDNVNGASRIDFTGARIGFAPGKFIHLTKDTQILVRLRAFRKIAEETKNHDLERDLYIEERKAERGVYLHQRWEALKKEGWKNWFRNSGRLLAHVLWIFVMFGYWALADYGRSFMRPLAALIVSGFVFYWGYGKVLTPRAGTPDVAKYERAVGMLALGNAVPFVGPLTIDGEIKRFLFCPKGDCPSPVIPPEGYQLLVVGQNLFSITCVFFIGLALRNYFRIK